jgi:hypothetical protein
MSVRSAKLFTQWRRVTVGFPYLIRAHTSCSIHSELLANLEYYSEVAENGEPFLKRATSLTDKEVSDLYDRFRSFIRQGKDFFLTALHLEYRTAPLLYYYSFLNFAKAALCTLSPRLILGAKKAHHGLVHRHQETAFEFQGVQALTNGIYPELYQALLGVAIVRDANLSIPRLLQYVSDVSFEPGQPLAYSKVLFASKCVEAVEGQESWILLAIPHFHPSNEPVSMAAFFSSFEEVLVSWEVAKEVFSISTHIDFRLYRFFQSKFRESPGDSMGPKLRSVALKYFSPCVHLSEFELDLSVPLNDDDTFPFNELLASYALYFYLGSLTRYQPQYLERLHRTKAAWVLDYFCRSAPITLLRHFTTRILGFQYIVSQR